jgi:tRNA acetyltransferase TAN1
MFNLIVTTYRHMESEAEDEIAALLKDFGDNSPVVRKTVLHGLLTCMTSVDPLEVVEKVRKIVQQDPWKVHYVLRLIPVERVVNTNTDEIRDAAKDLAQRIMGNETFRVTVEKRRSDIESMEIVKAVAEVIDRKVDLEKYDWVVLVEIIGKEAGISVLKPEGIFSAVKGKRESPE